MIRLPAAPIVAALVVAGPLLAGCATAATGTGSYAGPAPSVTATPTDPAAPNGVAAMDTAAVLVATSKALSHAGSVRVQITSTFSGHTMAWDVRLEHDKGGTGTLTFDGVAGSIVRLGPEVYARAPLAWWRELGEITPTLAARLAGNWVLLQGTTKPDSGYRQISNTTSIEFLSTVVSSQDVPDRTGGWPETTVNGTHAIRLDASEAVALYVATAGPPYPLRLTHGSGANRDQLDFSDFGGKVTLTRPEHPIYPGVVI
jgi:hypothetical protein